MKKNILYKPRLVAPLSLLVINSSPTPPRAVHPHRTPSSIFETESGAPDTLGVSASEWKTKPKTRVSQTVYPPGYTRATRERDRQRERKHQRTSFFLEKFHVTNPNAPRATNPANVLRLHAFGSANHPPYVVQTCPRIDRGSWCAGAPCPPIFVR